MPVHRGVALSRIWRLLIALVGWVVPGALRRAWLQRWTSQLLSLRILIDRGELIRNERLLWAQHWRRLLASALAARSGRFAPRHLPGSPVFLALCLVIAAALAALLTGGFVSTRHLLSLSARDDRVVGFGFGMVFALATGIVLVLIEHAPLQRAAWRYWSFFAAKLLGVTLLLPLIWVEAAHTAARQLPSPAARVWIAGVVLMLLFIVCFGRALSWVFADQRRRCPECARLLALPVALGSWASVFDPAATELLCDAGHGSLCLSGDGMAQTDQWTRLDESWNGLICN
ncbi:MAG: hypothetical protein NTY38_00135 [Acidobacteria bacterium]|nr:hypothetical protein [Acidobacteriota bacterium]